jgi:hypothetical protein
MFETGDRKVVDVRIINDRETGRSRGFGFVQLDSDASAASAIKDLDGQELDGRRLAIREAHDHPGRGPGGGGGGGPGPPRFDRGPRPGGPPGPRGDFPRRGPPGEAPVADAGAKPDGEGWREAPEHRSAKQKWNGGRRRKGGGKRHDDDEGGGGGGDDDY